MVGEGTQSAVLGISWVADPSYSVKGPGPAALGEGQGLWEQAQQHQATWEKLASQEDPSPGTARGATAPGIPSRERRSEPQRWQWDRVGLGHRDATCPEISRAILILFDKVVRRFCSNVLCTWLTTPSSTECRAKK